MRKFLLILATAVISATVIVLLTLSILVVIVCSWDNVFSIWYIPATIYIWTFFVFGLSKFGKFVNSLNSDKITL